MNVATHEDYTPMAYSGQACLVARKLRVAGGPVSAAGVRLGRRCAARLVSCRHEAIDWRPELGRWAPLGRSTKVFGWLKSVPFSDSVLGEFRRKGGAWRGEIAVGDVRSPFELPGSRAAPDAQALDTESWRSGGRSPGPRKPTLAGPLSPCTAGVHVA